MDDTKDFIFICKSIEYILKRMEYSLRQGLFSSSLTIDIDISWNKNNPASYTSLVAINITTFFFF